MRIRTGVVIRIAIALVIVALVVSFNRNVLMIRLTEIDSLIQRAAEAQQADAAELLLRYRLLVDRMERGIDSDEQIRAEAMLAVMYETPDTRLAEADLDTIEATLAFYTLNGIRELIGKPPLLLHRDESSMDRIAYAYMLERAHRWSEAIEAYRSALMTSDLSDPERANLMIHLGFCYSMDSRPDDAREVFEEIAEVLPESEHALVAREMIGYLDRFEEYRETETETFPGRSEFLTVDYHRALSELDRFIATQPSLEEEAEARYYRARALEETGRYEEAIEEYERISLLPSPEWNRAAGRRLIMIGEFYVPDEATSQAGGEILVALDDESFAEVLAPYQEIDLPPVQPPRVSQPDPPDLPADNTQLDPDTGAEPPRIAESGAGVAVSDSPVVEDPPPIERSRSTVVLAVPESEIAELREETPTEVAPATTAIPAAVVEDELRRDLPRSQPRAPQPDEVIDDFVGDGSEDEYTTPEERDSEDVVLDDPGADSSVAAATTVPPMASSQEGLSHSEDTPAIPTPTGPAVQPPVAEVPTVSDSALPDSYTDFNLDHYDYLGPIVGFGDAGTVFVRIREIHPRDHTRWLVVVEELENGGFYPVAAAQRTAVIDHTMIVRLLDPSDRDGLAVGDPVFINR